MVWDQLGRDAEQENARERDRYIGIYVGILAVILAVCSLGGSNATKDATLKNIEAANTWAFFQAKNLRRQVMRVEVDGLELRLATESGLTEVGREAIKAKIASYREQDEHLTKGKEGLDDLFARGKSLEAERDLAMRRDPYFDYGGALLQIAIVLASIAIVASGSSLLVVSAALAVVGTLLTVNGFTLAVAVPFIGS